MRHTQCKKYSKESFIILGPKFTLFQSVFLRHNKWRNNFHFKKFTAFRLNTTFIFVTTNRLLLRLDLLQRKWEACKKWNKRIYRDVLINDALAQHVWSKLLWSDFITFVTLTNISLFLFQLDHNRLTSVPTPPISLSHLHLSHNLIADIDGK